MPVEAPPESSSGGDPLYVHQVGVPSPVVDVFPDQRLFNEVKEQSIDPVRPLRFMSTPPITAPPRRCWHEAPEPSNGEHDRPPRRASLQAARGPLERPGPRRLRVLSLKPTITAAVARG